MNAHNAERMNAERMAGTSDKETLREAVRSSLSPEGVVTIIAFLQSACFYKPTNEDAIRGLQEAGWFADTLAEMLGVEEHNRLIDKLGL